MILHFREEKEKGISFSRDSRGEREIQNTNFAWASSLLLGCHQRQTSSSFLGLHLSHFFSLPAPENFKIENVQQDSKKINQNLVQIAMEGCKMASQASCITRSACYLLFASLAPAGSIGQLFKIFPK